MNSFADFNTNKIIKAKMKKLILLLTVICISLLINSCRKDAVTDSGINNYEQTSFFIKISKSSVPEGVNTIIGKLERNGFGTIVEQFEESSGYVQADFNNVFIGAWHLSVTAYTIENDPVYFGETDLYVTTGTNQVALTLNPVTGNLEVTIEFNTPNADSLLASYPFNGNATDESGNGNDGIIYGAALCSDRFGNPNSAYHFDGIDDYIEIGKKLKPNFPVSISAWVKMDSGFGKSGIFVNDSGDQNYYGVLLVLEANGIMGLAYGNGGSIGPNGRRSKGTIQRLQAEKWFHIVGIIENSETIRIFINNEEDIGNISGAATSMEYSNNNGIVGLADTDTGPNLNFMKGTIDDIKLFNKVLSKEEISKLYSGGN